MSNTPYTDAAARLRALPKAAVPTAARGPKIPEAGYLVEEIGDGLFWLADGVFQMMFVITDEGVIAVDAPPSLGHSILRAIRGWSRHLHPSQCLGDGADAAHRRLVHRALRDHRLVRRGRDIACDITF